MQGAAQTCQRAGDRQRGENGAVHIDAAVLSGELVGAHRLEPVAQGGLFDYQPDNHRHNQRHQNAPVCRGAKAQLADQILGQEGTGIGGDILGRLGGAITVDGGDARDKVGEVKGDPVEHDHGKHFIDAPLVFQYAHNDAPDGAGQHGADKAQGDEHNGRQVRQQNADAGRGHGADNELSFSADVEDTGAEGEGHGKARHDIGDAVNHNVGKALHAGHAGDQPSVGRAYVQTHDHQEKRADHKAQKDGQQDVDNAGLGNNGPNALFLIHLPYLPPSAVPDRSRLRPCRAWTPRSFRQK